MAFFAFAAHPVVHLNGVIELPLAHIVEQYDIDAGDFQNVVQLVVYVVNFDGDEFCVADGSRFFDDFLELWIKVSAEMRQVIVFY